MCVYVCVCICVLSVRLTVIEHMIVDLLPLLLQSIVFVIFIFIVIALIRTTYYDVCVCVVCAACRGFYVFLSTLVCRCALLCILNFKFIVLSCQIYWHENLLIFGALSIKRKYQRPISWGNERYNKSTKNEHTSRSIEICAAPFKKDQQQKQKHRQTVRKTRKHT